MRHCIGFLDLENLLSLRWAEDWRLKDSFRASVAADSSLELVLEVWNLISLPLCWPPPIPPPAESSSLKVDWPLNLPLVLVFSLEIWKNGLGNDEIKRRKISFRGTMPGLPQKLKSNFFKTFSSGAKQGIQSENSALSCQNGPFPRVLAYCELCKIFNIFYLLFLYII